MPSRRALLTSLAAGSAGLAGCTGLTGSAPDPLPDATPGPADWPTSGYDARNTRYNPGASPPRSEPSPRWTHDFDACYEPVVRGPRVVLNADDSTVGLRATDGERVWASDVRPWGFETPTLGAERAYATAVDCVVGLELATGGQTWQGQPCQGANTASGTVANGRLYLEHGGYFSALDAAGRTTWASPHDARGSPAIASETAYVATVFTIEAVDLSMATREWPWEDRDDDEPPHVTERAATTWSVPPRASTTGPRLPWSPAVSDATVFATAEYDGEPGGELWALARSNGDERWRTQVDPHGSDAPTPVGPPTPPVVTPDRVVTSLGDRQLRTLGHDGTTQWTRTLDHHVRELAAGGATLLAVTHDRSVETTAPGHARLRAFDLESGRPLWSKAFSDHVEGLAVAGGTVYTTTVTGRDADQDVTGERLLALG